eukprot:IDg21866t1
MQQAGAGSESIRLCDFFAASTSRQRVARLHSPSRPKETVPDGDRDCLRLSATSAKEALADDAILYCQRKGTLLARETVPDARTLSLSIRHERVTALEHTLHLRSAPRRVAPRRTGIAAKTRATHRSADKRLSDSRCGSVRAPSQLARGARRGIPGTVTACTASRRVASRDPAALHHTRSYRVVPAALSVSPRRTAPEEQKRKSHRRREIERRAVYSGRTSSPRTHTCDTWTPVATRRTTRMTHAARAALAVLLVSLLHLPSHAHLSGNAREYIWHLQGARQLSKREPALPAPADVTGAAYEMASRMARAHSLYARGPLHARCAPRSARVWAVGRTRVNAHAGAACVTLFESAGVWQEIVRASVRGTVGIKVASDGSVWCVHVALPMRGQYEGDCRVTQQWLSSLPEAQVQKYRVLALQREKQRKHSRESAADVRTNAKSQRRAPVGKSKDGKSPSKRSDAKAPSKSKSSSDEASGERTKRNPKRQDQSSARKQRSARMKTNTHKPNKDRNQRSPNKGRTQRDAQKGRHQRNANKGRTQRDAHKGRTQRQDDKGRPHNESAAHNARNQNKNKPTKGLNHSNQNKARKPTTTPSNRTAEPSKRNPKKRAARSGLRPWPQSRCQRQSTSSATRTSYSTWAAA